MEILTDILILAGIAACAIISAAALLWTFMEWRAARIMKRDREAIDRALGR